MLEENYNIIGEKTMSKHRICATATGLPKLSRRNFVTAAAVTPLAALPVGASVDDLVGIDGYSDYMRGYDAALKKISAKVSQLEVSPTQSPIQKLFSEWKGVFDNTNSAQSIADEKFYALCDVAAKIGVKILQQQVTSRKDLAAKILVDTGMGDYDLRSSMIEECRVLMGV